MIVTVTSSKSADGSSSEREMHFLLDEWRVVGTLTTPTDKSMPPIVLILHGMSGNRHGGRIKGSNKTLFGETARVLADGGVASLRISTAGRGGSEGNFHDMTLERRVQEALKAVEWITEQGNFDNDQISILGHSQGTIVAASTARRLDKLQVIKSVVMWAPQSNALASYRRSMGEAVYKKGLEAAPDEIVEWRGAGGKTRAFKSAFFKGLSDFDVLNDVENYRGRLLVITGKRDRWSTSDRARVFQNRHRGDTKMTEFDVGHRMGASLGISAVNAVAQSTLDWQKIGD